MKSLLADGRLKVLSGTTTAEEIVKVAQVDRRDYPLTAVVPGEGLCKGVAGYCYLLLAAGFRSDGRARATSNN